VGYATYVFMLLYLSSNLFVLFLYVFLQEKHIYSDGPVCLSLNFISAKILRVGDVVPQLLNCGSQKKYFRRNVSNRNNFSNHGSKFYSVTKCTCNQNAKLQ
jgi:hypothetical protein